MKDERKKRIKYRKNFFPTLIVILIFWVLSFLIVYFIEPDNFGIIPLFFFILFVALLFTFSTAFANTRRGLILSFSIILFLILRFLGIGNILNAILIAAIALTTEIYFIKQK